MVAKSVKIDKFSGRNSFSFRSKVKHLVQWTFGSMDDLVQWDIKSMIGNMPILSVRSVLDIIPVLGIWSEKYQTTDIVTNNQVFGLVANDSNRLGYIKKTRNKKLFSKGSKPDNIFNYCKGKGHWKSSCPKRKQSGSVTVAEDYTKSEQDIALVTDGNTHACDVWVLDTRVSYHICPKREWFTTYTLVDHGCIKMANNSISQVVGIGSVKIRTHDGRLCTLNNVRHVPSIEKNLIYASLLDSRGFKYYGRDGILKICLGFDVILKCVMCGTLYILQEFTVTGLVVASPSIQKDYMTKEWHRPCHISEGEMQMSKEDLLCCQKIRRLLRDDGLKFNSSRVQSVV
ncbi:Retrovirus-related Pol polyprotein from transposon TNT 1-94 [Cardamine amara subsp. amara]|uniref:Retrovirus-related Pol polyprotein from transposon TNT 1-94 n=1 Tax=Cardamine amara subsp. amara TaxID=228776 RepID=A0ABD1C212_CARAN